MPSFCKRMFQTQVAHDRTDHGPRQRLLLVPCARNDVQQLIAIDDPSQVIDHHQTIAIAVERNTCICACTPGTVSCKSSGEVDPQLRLILRPFGEQPIGTISAPRSARILGPTL